MWAGQAAGSLQHDIQSHGNAWPDRADIWTGQWQDRAVSTSLIATEQSTQYSLYTTEDNCILQQANCKFDRHLHESWSQPLTFSSTGNPMYALKHCASHAKGNKAGLFWPVAFCTSWARHS